MDGQQRGLDLELGDSGPSLRRIVLLVGLVFAVTLAIVVGKQMSAEAMAVVVGVVCGVAAGIPTSVLTLVVLAHRDRRRLEETDRRSGAERNPPVIVIQGGAPQALSHGIQADYWPSPAPGPDAQRRFHVVGDEDLLLDDRRY